MTRCLVSHCAVAALLLASAAPAVASPGLSIVVKPTTMDGQVSFLEVHEQLISGPPGGGALLRLRAPLAVFGVAAIADRMTGLTVTDGAGAVPLTIESDPRPPGFETSWRHWQATRPTVFPVTVRYRIPVQPQAEAIGPPYGMKASGGGVAGRGIGFLLLPENTTSTATQFGWDLAQLPSGSVGVITAGAGTVVVAGPPAEIASHWMLAGPARVHASTRAPAFEAYTLGQPPFDALAMMDWAERAYAYLATSLKFLGTPPYRLFFRTLDVPGYATGSAREEGGGALLTVGNTLGVQPLADFKNTVFHEMTHQWVGDDGAMGAWFVEGLTTYLSAVLPCQAGLENAQFCADGVNKFAADYYGVAAQNWSLAKIDATPGREDVRRVPYARGMLYFGQLNAQLLAHAKGKRNLQDVLAPLFLARTHGARLDDTAWEAMLLRELGPAAVAEFRTSVVDGTTTIVPPAGAFGPCLGRVEPVAANGVEQWRPIACQAVSL